MLETVGQFGLQRAGLGYVEEFSSYTVSIEQSDQVLGAGCGDSVHQGPGTVKYRRRELDHPHRW